MKKIGSTNVAALFAFTFYLLASSAMAGTISTSNLNSVVVYEGDPFQISNTIAYSPQDSTVYNVIDGSHFTATETLFDSATSGTVVMDTGNGSTQSIVLGQDLSPNSVSGTFTYGTYGTHIFSETVNAFTSYTQINYSACLGSPYFNGDCTRSPTTSQTFTGTADATFYGIVNVVDRAPVINNISTTYLTRQGSPLFYSVNATDFEALTYSWDLNGDGLFGDATGASGSFVFDAVGTHVISVRVSDGLLTTEQGFVVEVGRSITAVPEPETYAMMLAGLGLLGFMAKRRKHKEAA